MLQSVPDSIAFTVAANTPNGTQLPFELAVNNGMSVIKDTITLTYSSECASPTGLAATNVQESGTTLTWAAAAGASAYYLSIKPKSVSTWPGDTYTAGTSFTITGLSPATAYDWRVKSGCGTTYVTASSRLPRKPASRNRAASLRLKPKATERPRQATGSAVGRSWATLASSTASGGVAMTIPGTGVNVQNSLNGPRLDYDLKFSVTGTYYVWVRMAAGPDGIYDDSFHIGLDGSPPVTLNPNSTDYNNGNQNWSWVKAAGSTAFKVVINTPGSHTLNLWMREDGVRVDKFVMTTNASYTPTGTGTTVSNPCSGPVPASSRVAASETPTELLRVLAYPNPFEGTITVKVNESAEQETNLRLIDINGTTRTQLTLPAAQTEGTMQADGMPGGAYFMEIIRGGERKVIPLRKP